MSRSITLTSYLWSVNWYQGIMAYSGLFYAMGIIGTCPKPTKERPQLIFLKTLLANCRLFKQVYDLITLCNVNWCYDGTAILCHRSSLTCYRYIIDLCSLVYLFDSLTKIRDQVDDFEGKTKYTTGRIEVIDILGCKEGCDWWIIREVEIGCWKAIMLRDS